MNFRDRYNLERPVSLRVEPLPTALQNGLWRMSIVDATHCNAWNDMGKANLIPSQSGKLTQSSFEMHSTLAPNSVTFLEFVTQ